MGPVHPERNDKIIALRKAGVGPREIARQMGVTPCVVVGVLHRARLTAEPRGRGHGATAAYKKWAVGLLAGTSQAEAARLAGVCPRAIRKWRAQLRPEAA